MAEELYVDLEVCDVEELKERMDCLKDKVDTFMDIAKREVRMETVDETVLCRTANEFAKEYNNLNLQVFKKTTSRDPSTREFIESFAPPGVAEDKRMVEGAKKLLRELGQFELTIDEMLYACDKELDKPVTKKKPTESSVKYVVALSEIFPDFLRHLKEFSRTRKG